MEKKEHYQAKTIPGFGHKQEEVPIIDLTEHFTEDNPKGLCNDQSLPSGSNVFKDDHLKDVPSSEEFIDHILEMTNEMDFEQDRKVTSINSILSPGVVRNQSQEVTKKSFEVILPDKTNIGHISEDKKDVQFRQYKEALIFKSTLANKSKSISKAHKNRCKICSKRFATNAALIIHVDGVHNKLKPHKCPICLIGFAQSGHMRTHVDVVHKKIKRFNCKICSKAFVTNYRLKLHIGTFHNKINP